MVRSVSLKSIELQKFSHFRASSGNKILAKIKQQFIQKNVLEDSRKKVLCPRKFQKKIEAKILLKYKSERKSSIINSN